MIIGKMPACTSGTGTREAPLTTFLMTDHADEFMKSKIRKYEFFAKLLQERERETAKIA